MKVKMSDDTPAHSTSVPAKLIAAARGLLVEEGPSAIKARAVAPRAGLSTMVVYSHFGGVPELVAAVVEAGFVDFGQALADVEITDDPVSDLFVMALATVSFARANPHLYDAMFGLSHRATYRPTSSNGAHFAGQTPAFKEAHEHVIAATERMRTAGGLTISDTKAASGGLWSMIHGYIALELAQHFSDFADPVREVLVPMAVTLCTGMGATISDAVASHEAALDRFGPLPLA